MIVTVTLNPMLDKTVHVNGFTRGKIERASKVEVVVGGKGVNVSRQLARLGAHTLATGFLGGEVGTMLERLLDQEGIPHQFVRIAGMTREGVTYLEPEGTWTAVFEPPHRVRVDEAERLITLCRSLQQQPAWIVCSGSSPCPEADGTYAAVIRNARTEGIKTALDAYGLVFANALEEIPTLVKLNRDEYEQTFYKRLTDEHECSGALEDLLARGIKYAIITDGARPLYAASAAETWKVVPPEVRTINATGSGDSMTAGILYGLEQQWDFAAALRFGVAAGAANAAVWDVARSTWENIKLREHSVIMTKIRQ
jgi:1-phosphofructokinase family hexose kinase